MMIRWLVVLALLVPVDASAAWGWGKRKKRKVESLRAQEESETFNSAAKLFVETGPDKTAAARAFRRFLAEFKGSPRAADAEFLSGEAYVAHALSILEAEAASKKTSALRMITPRNPAAVGALENARDSFSKVVGDHEESGLAASAQYRLGEVAYNRKDWEAAIEEFSKVQEDHEKSYIVPESIMGIIYANLALERFSEAESKIFLLGETFPGYLRSPAALYAMGIVALHKGDYTNAEKSLKRVKTAEAQFYLGKTYLLSKRAFLAAAAFENLIRDYPESDLREEAQFFIGDSFFLAQDFEGAITKYQKFQKLFPQSPLRVSALFRIGSSFFKNKEHVEARAHFQSVLDRYPKDFFAPLAQYFIAESHLVAGQVRDALFAYTKVITQYSETTRISPLAHYKLAWTQFQVGDYAQTIQTSRNFLALYPTNALAKNLYLIMGNSLIKLKRDAEAVAAFQRIIDLAPASEIAEQALFTILQNQLRLKKYKSILTSYQFIFRHLPPSKSKWRALSYIYAAEAYLVLNQVDEAKVIFEMVRKVYPDEPAAFYAQDGLAWCYSYMGEDEMALEERQKLRDMMASVNMKFGFTGRNELGIADSMYNQKNYDEAFELYDEFVRKNPEASEAPSALFRAGMSLYHKRYYTQAIESWQRLLRDYPKARDSSRAAFKIADTLFRAQKYSEAITAYQGIIKDYPHSQKLPMAYLRIAQASYNAKDDPGALNDSLELIKKFPRSDEAKDALDLMEGVYDRSPQADFKTSLGQVVKATVRHPISGEAQFRLARRYFDRQDYAQAAVGFQHFSVEYTNHPNLARAQYYLGESRFNLKKFRKAIPAFERLLDNFKRDKDSNRALFLLASAYNNLKKYKKASFNYQRLIEEYPDSEYVQLAQFNLALAYKALGKYDLAQYAYQKYIAAAGEKDAGAQSALWEIFSIQRSRRDFQAALGTLEQIRDHAGLGSDIPLEATYRMGEVYKAMRRPESMIEVWENLRAMRPLANSFRLQALIDLAQLYEKSSDFAKAVSVYEDLARDATGKHKEWAAQKAAELGGKAKSEAGGRVMIDEGDGAPEAKPKAKTKRRGRKPSRRSKRKRSKKSPVVELPGMDSDQIQ